MRYRDIIAAGVLALILPAAFCWSLATGQTKEQASSKSQKWSSDRPAAAEVVFGRDDRYYAVLLCCWRIVVYERQGDKAAVLWDWDKPDGTVGRESDFVVRDVDGDGNEEVVFQIARLNLCLEENETVLYSPHTRSLFLLKYDGDIGLHLSPDLRENQKIREWLIAYWQERRKLDLNKMIITFDAQP